MNALDARWIPPAPVLLEMDAPAFFSTGSTHPKSVVAATPRTAPAFAGDGC